MTHALDKTTFKEKTLPKINDTNILHQKEKVTIKIAMGKVLLLIKKGVNKKSWMREQNRNWEGVMQVFEKL